ncbi:MAG: hypothetical protein ACW967_04265 [Candidatus Hodarchaeales archaeon]|jgi:hypothetical protein
MKSDIWELLELSEEEKIIALLACHQTLSINEISDNFVETDYLETAQNLELLLEKQYIQLLGQGSFELTNFDKILQISKNLRRKIVDILDEKLLNLSESINDVNKVVDLFSAIDFYWGNWLRRDIPQTFSLTKKKIQQMVENKLKPIK